MTLRDLSSMLNALCYLEAHPGLQVLCRITNAKVTYGRARYEIEPVSGKGRAWVNVESIRLAEGGERD